MPIYLMSIRVLLSVELCVTLKTYLKGAPFYNAWESRGGLRDFQAGWESRFFDFSSPRLFHSPSRRHFFCCLRSRDLSRHRPQNDSPTFIARSIAVFE